MKLPSIRGIGHTLTHGVLFWLSATVTVILVSLVYATASWGSLPTVTSGSMLTATAWNDLVAHVNQSVKQASPVITVSGSNVWIGTANPGQTLSVSGTIESMNGGVKFPDGTTQTSTARGATRIARFTGSSLGGASSGIRRLELATTEYNTSGYTLAGNTVTIQNAGYYRIFAAFGFDVVDTATDIAHWFYLYKNWVSFQVLDYWYGVGYGWGVYYTDTTTLKGQYTGYFNAGDTVSLYTNCTTSANISAYAVPISLEIQAL